MLSRCESFGQWRQDLSVIRTLLYHPSRILLPFLSCQQGYLHPYHWLSTDWGCRRAESRRHSSQGPSCSKWGCTGLGSWSCKVGKSDLSAIPTYTMRGWICLFRACCLYWNLAEQPLEPQVHLRIIVLTSRSRHLLRLVNWQAVFWTYNSAPCCKSEFLARNARQWF